MEGPAVMAAVMNIFMQGIFFPPKKKNYPGTNDVSSLRHFLQSLFQLAKDGMKSDISVTQADSPCLVPSAYRMRTRLRESSAILVSQARLCLARETSAIYLRCRDHDKTTVRALSRCTDATMVNSAQICIGAHLLLKLVQGKAFSLRT